MARDTGPTSISTTEETTVRKLFVMAALFGSLTAAVVAVAQQPGDKKDGPSKAAEAFVAKLMALDKNKDGKLSKDEITDERLRDLFDRADTNKDGVVTKEELLALFEKEGGGERGGDGPGGRG